VKGVGKLGWKRKKCTCLVGGKADGGDTEMDDEADELRHLSR
jgi:hypothetical protein